MNCDADLLNIILLVKNVLDLMYVLVPILLIVLVSIDLGKIVIGKVEESSKVVSTMTKRIIVGLVVFFVPLIVTVLLDLISHNEPDTALACWDQATSLVIEEKKLEEDGKEKVEEEVKKKEKNKKKQEKEDKKKDEKAKKDKEKNDKGKNDKNSGTSDGSALDIPKSTSLAPYVNGKQRALKDGECMKKSDNCACPAYGKLSGFYFTMKTRTGRDMKPIKRSSDEKIIYLKVECSDGTYISGNINSKFKSNFKKAFKKACELRTTGIQDPDTKKMVKIKFVNGGTYVARTTTSREICSLHAYGAAIDVNNALSIKVNGKEYTPYSGMGTGTKKEYDSFVKALGSKKDLKNYNYILWKYAFEPAGFEWGGNWTGYSFDPMHFQIA